MVHLPGAGHSQTEYQNPTVKEWMDTYLAGNEKYTTEERLRALFLCQEIAGSKFTGNWMGWAVNASGSPVTGEIFVRLVMSINLWKLPSGFYPSSSGLAYPRCHT